MIIGLAIGRKGSSGFPGKNLYPVLGKPLCHHVFKAATDSNILDHLFLSTDDPALMEIAEEIDVTVIRALGQALRNEGTGEDATRIL